jgi:hypothetical protein
MSLAWTARAQPDPTADLQGAWSFISKDGRLLNIVLMPDGKAISSWWEPERKIFGESGKYSVAEDGTATLTFPSGWRDVLKPSADGFTIEAFNPSAETAGLPPTIMGPANRVAPPLGNFVGVWQANMAQPWGRVVIALKSDGTARTTDAPDAEGTWQLDSVHKTAMIDFPGRVYYTLVSSSESTALQLNSWQSGAPKDGDPTAAAPAVPLAKD